MLFVFNNLTHIQKQECVYIGFFKYLALHKSKSFSQKRKKKHFKTSHVNLLPSQSIPPINTVKKTKKKH